MGSACAAVPIRNAKTIGTMRPTRAIRSQPSRNTTDRQLSLRVRMSFSHLGLGTFILLPRILDRGPRIWGGCARVIRANGATQSDLFMFDEAATIRPASLADAADLATMHRSEERR